MNKNKVRAGYVVLAVSMAVFLAACSSDTQPGSGADGYDGMKVVRVNDTSLHYVDHGQGTPVVFVHGNLGDYRTWDAQVEAVSNKYRAISYSRRLHFPNDIPSDALDSTTYYHVEDLKAFIRALGIERMHLVGHSGGGAISLLFAREYPDYLISLTLGEPAVSELIASMPEGVVLRQAFGETVSGPTTEAFQAGKDEEGVRLFIDGVQGEAKGFDDLPLKFRERMLQNAPSLRISRMDKVSRPRLTCEDAGQIQVPTLLIHGELSPKIFVLTNDVLEECMPNVERALLPSSSHGLEMENPDAFNEIVLGFLTQHR